jgi:hypothetical protein
MSGPTDTLDIVEGAARGNSGLATQAVQPLRRGGQQHATRTLGPCGTPADGLVWRVP